MLQRILRSFLLVACACTGAFGIEPSGQDYAVLVAGSHGYDNYRHHADICHAFKLLTEDGIPRENIIVMLYDDVADDPSNPFPGRLFNQPSTEASPGEDVYVGCQKDYTGSSVTAQNFLSVITGDQSAVPPGHRVLNSTARDRVFINFADHGGPGLLAMPYGPYLYREELQNALLTMHSKNMYKELVFYVEACESGSMFEGLPANLNIYVTTAANATESSWGTYCPPNDNVYFEGKSLAIGSCLGDLYSVNWMQNTDEMRAMHMLSRETLATQYRIVKNETTLSHVQQFGTLFMSAEPIGDYEGTCPTEQSRAKEPRSAKYSVLQHNASIHGAFYSYVRALTRKVSMRVLHTERLMAHVIGRDRVDRLFTSLRQNYEKVFSANWTRIIPMEDSMCRREFDSALRLSPCGHDVDGAVSVTAEYALRYSNDIIRICIAENKMFPKHLGKRIAKLDCNMTDREIIRTFTALW